MLRRLGFSAAFVAALAMISIPAAGAGAPIHEELTFSDATFADSYLSDACGTAVLDTFSGRLTAALFGATEATPAHEVDTITGTITYSAPASGNSVSKPLNGTSHSVYPEGISPGSPAIVRMNGVNAASFTGTAPPGSGQLAANATILFVDDAGVPGTAFAASDIVSMNGNYAASTAAICAALS